MDITRRLSSSLETATLKNYVVYDSFNGLFKLDGYFVFWYYDKEYTQMYLNIPPAENWNPVVNKFNLPNNKTYELICMKRSGGGGHVILIKSLDKNKDVVINKIQDGLYNEDGSNKNISLVNTEKSRNNSEISSQYEVVESVEKIKIKPNDYYEYIIESEESFGTVELDGVEIGWRITPEGLILSYNDHISKYEKLVGQLELNNINYTIRCFFDHGSDKFNLVFLSPKGEMNLFLIQFNEDEEGEVSLENPNYYLLHIEKGIINLPITDGYNYEVNIDLDGWVYNESIDTPYGRFFNNKVSDIQFDYKGNHYRIYGLWIDSEWVCVSQDINTIQAILNSRNQAQK